MDTDNRCADEPKTQNGPSNGKFSNNEYRKKFITSVLLCYVFFSGGWLLGQKGPSFLDILQLSTTSTASGSAYFAALYVGIGVGSLLTGPLIDRFRDILILLCGICVISVTNFIMPWCTLYWTMVFINLLQGIGGGILSTACFAMLPTIWRMEKEGRTFMQAMNFCFALASVLSPFALKPYLIPTDDEIVRGHNSSNNCSTTNLSISEAENKLYIPYSVTGAIVFIGVFPVSCMYIYSGQADVKHTTEDDSKVSNQDASNSTGTVTLYFVLCMSLVGCLLFSYYANEASTASYLAAFAVDGLNWNKQSGADLTSTFWATLAIGRFIGIFVSHLIRPSTLIFLCSLGNFFSTLGFYFGSAYIKDIPVWIFTAASGACMSFIFPSIFSWTQEDITNISGKISAYLQVIVCVSGSTCPLALGYFMANFTPLYFVYLRLFLCGSGIVFFIILFLFLKFSKNNRKSHEIYTTSL